MAADGDRVYSIMCMSELPEETKLAILQALECDDAPVVIPPDTLKVKEVNRTPDHRMLELIDPTPDIYRLFQDYNTKYFFDSLFDVVVGWGTARMSPRTAGYCCYEGEGGLCSVKLNRALLQYRPRIDLVSTLLHEMIHAYLFVTQRNIDRDGHGPEFLKEAKRIGDQEACKITIYHSFRDEMDHIISQKRGSTPRGGRGTTRGRRATRGR